MIITKTPLRISLAGGGTDLKKFYSKNNGLVFNLCINKYIYVVVKKQPEIVDYKYRINWSKNEFKNSINSIEHPIIRETLKYFKIYSPIEITTFSDIPANTGLGSSSAFTVGLVNALSVYLKKKYSKKKIADVAADIEINFVKRNIGKQDHYATSIGGINKIKFLRNGKVILNNLNFSKKVINGFENSSMLFYTYKQRDAGYELSKQFSRFKDNEIKLIEIKNLVSDAIAAFSSLDIKKLGSIIDKNWQIKSSMSTSVSNKSINDNYNKAKSKGAYGGKILGAGNGGFLFLLAKSDDQKNIIKKLNQYTRINFKLDLDGTQVIYN